MARTSLAQIGEGDPKVVAHPGFREMPACQFTLETEKAKKVYADIGRMIWGAGRLSMDMHLTLSTYASLVDQITVIEGTGARPKGVWYRQLQEAQKRLKLDDLGKPISAPKEAHTNRYARFGFSHHR